MGLPNVYRANTMFKNLQLGLIALLVGLMVAAHAQTGSNGGTGTGVITQILSLVRDST